MKTKNQFIDILGRRFGRLTVVARAENDQHGNARWHCRCQCGGTATTAGGNLRQGRIASCGCLKTESSRDKLIIDGWSYSAEHCAWRNLCRRSRIEGLWVPPEWLNSFQAFLADVGEKPCPRHRLRNTNDGFQWVPPKNLKP